VMVDGDEEEPALASRVGGCRRRGVRVAGVGESEIR
jgi:hypothetical protein